MTKNDDDRPGAHGVSTVAVDHRSHPRRWQLVVGGIGLAGLLGAGAYTTTAFIADRRDATVNRDTGAIAAVVPTTAAPTQITGSAPASRDAPTKAVAAPTASRSRSKVASVAEEIKKARDAAERDGFPLRRPLTVAPHVADLGGPVHETNQRTKKGSMRVVTANYDLTGQRELLWAGDWGTTVGDARCTQNFHFSNDENPRVLPTMLLCWRTSAARSVVTVAVSYHGTPARADSVAVLDGEWAKR
jgi:hypothetical protein